MRRHFGQLLCYLVPGLWLSGQFLLPSPSLFFPCFVPLARNLETLSTEANFYFCFVLRLQQRLKMDIGALASLKATFEDATNGFPAKLAHPRNGRKHSFGRIHFAGKAVVFLSAVFWWRRKMSAVFSGFVCAKSEFVLSKIGKPPPC